MSAARILLAFAAAPFASSLALAAGFTALSGAEPAAWFSGTLFLGLLSLLFTIPATLIGGLPSFLILKAMRRDSLPWFIIAGALIGLLAGALLLSSGGTPDEQREPGWILLLITTVAGAVGGVVFGTVRGPSRALGGSTERATRVP